ncbi:3-hydroxybutyryl-CoA dehydrogenase [Plantactinospora sp. KLBMP9567]|uniref:3-hydroxyacyl-CoA dehydrogenase family protein n=1 Tax=Plantactinospora sp. KLBMP9567 TaxID=3085900 RepID=UPI0029812E14|nr:3-hydroxybutyryl-CoA dehydrogenase [Plantactinospora sp. KLBMP9567]MDW5323430.1 3-hydroxybutyryl-CoA dehydrogenase [Plantactinospora sp. KLBMP9567]
MAGERTGADGTISTVGVVGLGTMGAGIAEVFARGGLRVVAVEITAEALEHGRATLARSTDRAVQRGRLSAADRDGLLGRITFAVGLPALAEVDLVVEAVPERLDLKRQLFADLDRICRPTAILASNTSSLSVTEIAVATGRPDRVVGMHFFNPAPVMKLVEVVRTVTTSAEVVGAVQALCARLGKVGVTIGDRAGFVANALLFGYLNQAVAMVESRYAGRDDIDAAMRLGGGLPMGPLALLDMIGLDTAYEILETMYRRGGRDRRHAPVPLLRQMVTAGLLGRKSGQGFYRYERPGSAGVVPDEQTPAAAPLDGARPVRRVGVVGTDDAVTGLGELFGQAGYDVVVVSRDAGRTGGLAGLAGLADADLVVEAVTDDLAVKRALFAELAEVCKPETLLATTTGTLPVIDVAMAARWPAEVVGLHLPVPTRAGAVVEIVRTVRSSVEAVATARSVCAGLGRTAVVCGDRTGFVVRALLFPYLNDAVRMLEASYASVDDIDHAMTLGCGYPAGPFEVLDRLGPEVVLRLQRSLYRESREPGLAPAPLLEQLVTSGRRFRDGAAG